MVDLVEIGLSVDSSDFVKAAADTKGFELAVAKMVQTILRENSVLKAASKASADARAEAEQRAIQKQIEANQKLTATKEKEAAKQQAIADRQAKAEMDAYVRTTIAAEKAAMAKAKAAQASVGGNLGLGAVGVSAGASASAISAEIDRLRLKYDQIYASSKLYESALNELNRAQMLGAISDRQRQASLDALNSQLANGTGIFANYTQQVGSNTNRMGVAFQQTGYQVSDFIVQIQGGTNPLVAFSQQATQLAGLMYLLPPALQAARLSFVYFSISVSAAMAAVTILIPLLSMLVMAFVNANKASEDTSKSIDKQTQAYDSLISKIEELRLARQMEASGAATKEEQTIQNTLNTLLAERIVLQDRLNKLKEIGGRATAFAEQKKAQLDLLQVEIDKNTEALKAIDYERILSAAANRRANERRDSYREEKKEVDARNLALLNSYEYMAETMRLSAEQVASYEKENEAINNKLVMEVAIAKFGKDSAEVKKLQREEELDLYDQAIDAQVILGKYTKDQGQALKDSNSIRQDAVDLQQKETDALNRGKALAREFLSTYTDIGGAIKSASEIDIGSVFSKAISPSSSLYQFVKKTYDTMLNMANMTIRPKLKFDTASYSEPKQPFGFGNLGPDQVFTAGVGFESTTGAGVDKTETGGGGGGAKTDPLVELQKQIALQEELNGKTEAERKVREALGDNWKDYSPLVIKGLEDQIQKQIELEERLKDQQQIFDTVKTSMEDAFMGMVDGTKSAKDAFKQMAAAIIKELYNVLVVQRMVGSFDQASGQGSGIMGLIFKGVAGAFGGGGTPLAGGSMRANGGPVSAGQPYLVGERGPELIIPKSSGMVLTNNQTKTTLGGSSNESYVVNNNINVTGSDSMMVRQEIAKMIPQISSATKAAMIDAKRRGGQMGNAFR